MATNAKEIMALACAIAGEDITKRYGTTTAAALDALADALAGTDVESRSTIAGEVGMLGPYVQAIAENVKALASALETAGIDAGGGSLAEVLEAAAGGIESGELGGDFADDEADIDKLFIRQP